MSAADPRIPGFIARVAGTGGRARLTGARDYSSIQGICPAQEGRRITSRLFRHDTN